MSHKRSTVDAGLGGGSNGGKIAKIDPDADLASGEQLSEEVNLVPIKQLYARLEAQTPRLIRHAKWKCVWKAFCARVVGSVGRTATLCLHLVTHRGNRVSVSAGSCFRGCPRGPRGNI